MWCHTFFTRWPPRLLIYFIAFMVSGIWFVPIPGGNGEIRLFWSYGYFSVARRVLAERYSLRLLLAGGTAILALAFMLLGYAGGFTSLLLLAFFSGLGSGPQHPLSSTLVAKAYEIGPRRAALGIYNFSGDIGKVICPAILALVAGAVGWRVGVIGFGVFGFISALIILMALIQLNMGSKPQKESNSETNPQPAGWGILNSRGFAAISGINLLDTGVTFGFLSSKS